MDIHEHQAKELLAGFGVPVPHGGLAFAPEQAVHHARRLGFPWWSRRRSMRAAAARPGASSSAGPKRRWPSSPPGFSAGGS
jgi:hypothetical protein